MEPPTLKLIDGELGQSCPMGMNMTDLTDRYIDGRWKRREIERPTRDRLRTVLGAFAKSFGNRDPRRFGGSDIDRWLESRSHLKQSTRHLEWSIVSGFSHWLTEKNIVRRDPFIGRKAPKVPRAASRALTGDDCAALERALPDRRAWAVYALMRWVGLRRAEVLTLQVGDWDRRSGVLHVVGKGGHAREEPVPPWASERLDAYLAETGATTGPLIRGSDGLQGLSKSHLSRLMNGWMRAAGVKARAYDGRACHSLRHTIASELIESGADIKVVQELLGHVSLTSTQVYLRRAATGRVLEAMERARAA